MYLVYVTHPAKWGIGGEVYEFKTEEQALKSARTLAEQGVETVVYKPYKRFEKPKPQVVEVTL